MEGKGLESAIGTLDVEESLKLVEKWLGERCYAIALFRLNLLEKYHLDGNGNGNGNGNGEGSSLRFLKLKLRAYEIGIEEDEKAIKLYEKRYLPNPNNTWRCRDNIAKYQECIAGIKEKVQSKISSIESKISLMTEVKVAV